MSAGTSSLASGKPFSMYCCRIHISLSDDVACLMSSHDMHCSVSNAHVASCASCRFMLTSGNVLETIPSSLHACSLRNTQSVSVVM